MAKKVSLMYQLRDRLGELMDRFKHEIMWGKMRDLSKEEHGKSIHSHLIEKNDPHQ